MRGFLNQILKKLGISPEHPPFEGLYIYALILLVGYFLADLAQLAIQNSVVPTLAPKNLSSTGISGRTQRVANYGDIIKRNPFNSDGLIPKPLSELAGEGPTEDGPAIPSNLPLRLVGTIVHANPNKSVATIELKNKSKVMTFVQNDEIEGVGAKITSVERLKVIFRNLQTNGLEYIEIKEAFAISFGAKSPSVSASSGKEEIIQGADNKFTLSRSLVSKHLNNLTELVQQARAVPNIDPATGAINGFRLLDIAPGSIFEQLGIRRHDVIKSVNKTIVDSPAKAMELLNKLKNADNINLVLERNGRDEDFSYGVTN
jgi:general secretion pathway protein C